MPKIGNVKKKFVQLSYKRIKKGHYEIIDKNNRDYPMYGPYKTVKEVKEAMRGLNKFYKEFERLK